MKNPFVNLLQMGVIPVNSNSDLTERFRKMTRTISEVS